MMMFLILAYLLGFSAGSLIEKGAPALNEVEKVVLDGKNEAGSLSKALGLSNLREIDNCEKDITESVSKALRRTLYQLLENTENDASNAKEVATFLSEQVTKAKETLKVIGNKRKKAVKMIKEKGKETVKKLMDKLGLGKKNLDFLLDAVIRVKFNDIIGKTMEQIFDEVSIKNIKKYIRNIDTKNQVIQMFKKSFLEMEDADILAFLNQMLLRDSGLNERSRKELMKNVTKYFKKFGTELAEKTAKFAAWMRKFWNGVLDKLLAKYELIKSLCLQFLTEAKDDTSQAVVDDLHFFQSYRKELGIIWDQLVESVNHIYGGVGYTCKYRL